MNARFNAVQSSPFEYLWQTVAYYHSPLVALWLITQRAQEAGDEDMKKIFFDCVRSRLNELISSEVDLTELDHLGQIIKIFFNFDFFVEDVYFQELAALLTSYRSKLQRVGGIEKRNAFDDKLFHVLHAKEKLLLNPVPQGIENLSLPVQRHLASNGAYVEMFACHNEPRIARETQSYIKDTDALARVIDFAKANNKAVNSCLVESLPVELQKFYDLEFDNSSSGKPSESQPKGRTLVSFEELSRHLSPEEIRRMRGGKKHL